MLVESFRPGVMDRLGVGYDALRERNPRLIYCPISGYGQDGPLTARSGHDTNYLALNGLLGPHRAPRRSADPVRRPDRRPRRRRADGGGRDPRGAARARALGRGPDGRHLDDRRLALVARDGGRAVLRGAEGPASRRAGADRRHRLLRPLRGQGRRLGLAGRARAEVLAELVQRRRAPGPDREAVRAPGLRGGRRDRSRVQGADARRVDGVRGRARLLPGADPRPRRGARLGAGAGARDGRRAGPARHRRRSSRSAPRSSCRARRPTRAAPRPRSAQTRTTCCARSASTREPLRDEGVV